MNRRDPLAGLHVFRQVTDTGSFTRAAALLGVTPAAVSQAINQLEAELRLKLFHRTTRGVSLSEAGQRYHEQTEQPYRDLVRAREALGESLAEPSGQLRISALHLAKNLVIAPMLNEFVRRYPKVQLEIRYEDQLVDIVRERLDAGIRLADALQPGMVGVQLTAPLACLLVATPTYLAEYGTPASVADLDGHAAVRFRFPRSGRLHKWRLREDGRELEVDLPARFVSTDTETIIEAARAGAGIAQAFIRERVAADLAAGRLVEVLPGSCLPLPPMWLYYLNRRHVPAKLRAFIELLREWRQPA
ncbi:LysR family transcriptional regulator [Pseudomonas aeruginosa]|uniref:LysR family transcriptional regulator n=1 Tax=Pseudomonas aeruginosa TaxID=287 RepID=UPI001068F06F|nr:LysR family transcriptional regulator [Pseudomonas aeruginosa]MCW4648816.1 LysR family transcriptional regulator [Pseudomonas aeruginosa]